MARTVAFAQAIPSDSYKLPTDIRIGSSAVPLTGPWRFAPGDSPGANGVRGTTPDSGGMHETPLVDVPAEMECIRSQEVLSRFVDKVVFVYVSLVMVIAAAGAFWIWLLDRPRTTYLWCPMHRVVVSRDGWEKRQNAKLEALCRP